MLVDLPASRELDTSPNPTWTFTERTVGRAACWVIVILSLAYVPLPVVLLVMARAFAATPVVETSR